ncbi:hypothetical protein GC163_01065 [bacterium]|nr:hypothetical protein [bacterium]
MPLQVQITAGAARNVQEIFDWIAERSRNGAEAWYAAYLKHLRQLADEAPGCGVAPEAGILSAEIRQALFKTRSGRPFRTLFVIREQTVFVIGVRGHGQDLAMAEELDLPE